MKKALLYLMVLTLLVNDSFSQVCPTTVNNNQYNETTDLGGAAENPMLNPFTYTFIPGSGTKRLLLLFITYETENPNGPNNFSTISYGGKTLTTVVNQTISAAGTQQNRLAILYLKEIDIASRVGNTVSITFANPGGSSPNGSIRGVAVNSIVLENVDQATPLVNIQSATNTAIMTITVPAALPATVGNLMLAAVNMALATATVGPSTPAYSVFISKQVAGSHTHSVSYKKIISAGNEQPGFTANVVTRQIIGSVEVKASSTAGSCNITLPLHLLAFAGNLENNAVTLHWKTDTESDLTLYNIQKSTDPGTGFFTIGSVPSRNSASLADYYFRDIQTQFTTAYYRLEIVGQNGSVTYSSAIKISNRNLGNSITVSSPFTSSINIFATSLTRQNAILSLSDDIGKHVFQKLVVFENGVNSLSYPMEGFLARGMYFLTIQTENKTFKFKIIKE